MYLRILTFSSSNISHTCKDKTEYSLGSWSRTKHEMKTAKKLSGGKLFHAILCLT